MASNELPSNQDKLFTLAEDMADGCKTHEAVINLKQNKEVDLRTDLGTATASAGLYDASRSNKIVLGTTQTVADSNAKSYLGSARKILAVRHGETWSEAWLQTGFPNYSTAVPPTVAERQALLFSLNTYFIANPAHENAPLTVTAAQGLLLGTALSAARSAVNDGATDSGQKKNTRDTAVTGLRKRMRGLITELNQLLGDEDPRWMAFGLNMPGASNLPDVPDLPVLTAGAPGHVIADWPDVARADHYRVYKKVAGVDPDFLFALSVNDSDATLPGLPGGVAVSIRVTATNDSGESQPSLEAQIVVL